MAGQEGGANGGAWRQARRGLGGGWPVTELGQAALPGWPGCSARVASLPACARLRGGPARLAYLLPQAACAGGLGLQLGSGGPTPHLRPLYVQLSLFFVINPCSCYLPVLHCLPQSPNRAERPREDWPPHCPHWREYKLKPCPYFCACWLENECHLD
jgi:hypothetical protein